jgi:hypothetical protein
MTSHNDLVRRPRGLHLRKIQQRPETRRIRPTLNHSKNGFVLGFCIIYRTVVHKVVSLNRRFNFWHVCHARLTTSCYYLIFINISKHGELIGIATPASISINLAYTKIEIFINATAEILVRLVGSPARRVLGTERYNKSKVDDTQIQKRLFCRMYHIQKPVGWFVFNKRYF